MRRMRRAATTAALTFTLIAITFQLGLFASHSWGGYHWARTANPFTLQIGDNVTTQAWEAALAGAAHDWGIDPKPLYGWLQAVKTLIVPGRVTNNRRCSPTSGQDEVCNAAYGNNGWLGLAQIWVNGTHITQGVVKLNDTYFNNPPYNTQAWRNLVTCQEIGHTLGLDHQNTNFNDPNLGTCMDYTNNPTGPPDNEHPNSHDYEELQIIYYDHLDTASTVKSSPSVSNARLEDPSQWGRLMKSTRSGRTQVFERDFGNGERVVTFVIWA